MIDPVRLNFEKRLRYAGQRFARAKADLAAESAHLHELVADASELFTYQEIAELTGMGYSRVRQVGWEVQCRRKLQRYRDAFDAVADCDDPVTAVADALGVSIVVASHYLQEAGCLRSESL